MTYRFGIQLAPSIGAVDELRALARLADSERLDLLGVQDHPYAPTQLDTFALMATMLADTSNITVFPDVANLPLRGPAMLGKAAQSLDHISGGRFDLGLGAGGFWPAIAAMGGPSLSAAQARDALEEGIAIMRAMWEASGESVRLTGDHYKVSGFRSGPPPSRRIGIWIGSVGPKAHVQTGRLADGWAAPIPHYLHYEKWSAAQDLIDSAASDAGRDPASITRIAQLVGDIADGPVPGFKLEGEAPIRASAGQWASVIAELAHDTRFDTFVYWPERADETQLLRWARDVIPAARELLGGRGHGATTDS
jgi:alkanesulfonate monooxygenase SsuD/methylene tetrahydromethanopterin reductase-like flavin-dependent oxidoreductase (luciferase family)